MKPQPQNDAFFKKYHPKFYHLMILVIFCFYNVNAQTKKPTATASPNPAKTAAPVKATTPPKTVSTASTIEPTDVVLHSTTKVLSLGDPNYEKTAKHAKRKAKYAKAFDDTAKRKVNGVNIKFVKNPSFGNQPTTYKAKTKKGSEKKEKSTDKGQEWDCSSSTVSLTANSSNFLNADYAGTAGTIYPGAIYTFDDFFSGNQKPILGKRNTMQLTIDNTNINGSAYVNIKSPDVGTTTNAVDKLTKELHGPTANFEFNSTTYQTSNSQAQSLQVSGGGSYDGFSAQATVGTSSESNTVNVTIDATKILYTIRVTAPDSGFFADPKVENTHNLMVVSRVSYGVRVLANFTYTFNSNQDAINFQAKYSGFGATANVNINDISNSSSVSSSINCYVIGGPGNTTLSFNKKDLEKQLKAVFAGATYQNAKPISYSFTDMADDVIGSYSATDDFVERNCVPNDANSTLQSIYITYQTGIQPGDDKHNDNHYHVFLYPGNTHSANNYNGNDNPAQNNGEAYIAGYETGPLNIYFGAGTSHTDQLAVNPFSQYLSGLTNKKLTYDYFVKNGGLIHFHVYPNGSDTWGIQKVTLTLNFTGGLSQPITFSSNGADVISLSDGSTEGSLLFDGTFKQRQ